LFAGKATSGTLVRHGALVTENSGSMAPFLCNDRIPRSLCAAHSSPFWPASGSPIHWELEIFSDSVDKRRKNAGLNAYLQTIAYRFRPPIRRFLRRVGIRAAIRLYLQMEILLRQDRECRGTVGALVVSKIDFEQGFA
jgi:hypothetical protein